MYCKSIPMFKRPLKGRWPLLTEFAASALVELATETLLHEVVEAVAEGFELHVVDDLVDESILQKQLSLIERYTALAHVEERGIVELANRRSMGTFHIVSIDFEHRLGIHTGLTGSRQILVGHLRGCLLSSMFYQYPTRKSTYSLIVEHVFIELV